MENISNTIEQLVAKCISGNASDEEIALVESWKSESDNNLQNYQSQEKAWMSCSAFLSGQDIQKDKENILLEIFSREQRRRKRSKRLMRVYQVAAVLAFPLAFVFSRYLVTEFKPAPTVQKLCTISAPKGYIAKCTLPDGSEVWVNTHSSIFYDAASFNESNRDVILEGEAYFEVTKNVEKPFRVKTRQLNVLVTGTSFNIKAYPESKFVETVLAEGRIEMELNNEQRQKIELKPGEKAVYDNNRKSILITPVDCQVYTAWRNGEIIFKDATMQDLINELERLYDIRFKLEDKSIGEFRFRGMFSYNNNLIDALEKIKRTSGIDYFIQNKEVELKKIKIESVKKPDQPME